MNASIPAADASPGSERDQTLRAIVDMLVPASPDRRLPGAADLPPLLRHMEQFAVAQPALGDALDSLQHEALARHGIAFAGVDRASRAALLDEFGLRYPALLQRLALETVTCYYQQDGVVEALGMQARPPYPTGYQVLAGDLSLLKPVMARGRIWRDAS